MIWRRWLRRRWWDRERRRELDSYLEIETAENISRGMTEEDAAAAARRKLGNLLVIREEIYRMNSIERMESVWQDLRHGARLLRLSPGFALVAILSLALGIGANAAIFQLLDAVRLRSLPVPNPDQLTEVRIAGGNHGLGITTSRYAQLTRPIWTEVRDRQKAFSGVFAWGEAEVRVGKGAEIKRARALFASGEMFGVLGVKPVAGRLFLPEDEATACPVNRVVVSYSYWRDQMGSRSLDGASLLIDGQYNEVIGVTPPGFFGLAVGESFDLSVPFCTPKQMPRNVFSISVMGRLRPGWTLERASAHLNAVSPGIFEATEITGYNAESTKRYRNFRLAAYPASSGVSWLREQYDASLWLLLALTGLVLLIACANLANLMLARASAREREIAVRLALGASKGRLVRQLIAESSLLAMVGAVVGVGVAGVLSRLLVRSLSTENFAVDLRMTTDWHVLAFAAAAAAVTCLVFGVAPAWRATNTEPISAMKSGGRGVTAARSHFSMQRLMVVMQISISLVLLVGALLFVRSFRNLMTFDPGMRQSGVTVAFIGFYRPGLSPDRFDIIRQEILEDVERLPGVDRAATTSMVPLIGGSWGHGIHIGEKTGGSMFTWVSPGYFRTMEIPLLAGRDFDRTDTRVSKPVAVVNQAFVRKYLGTTPPLGQTLRTDPEPEYPSTVFEIVGVIADTQYDDLRGEPPPIVYGAAPQYPPKRPGTAMMIHSNIPPESAIQSIKRMLAQKHPESVAEFSVLQQRVQDGFVRERLMAMLSGFFGMLAVLLATVGLYGVISYVVARRRNEIGIRLALGARPGKVVRMVMREVMKLLIAGAVIGLILALAAGQAARSLLFKLTPYDPLTLVLACLLLGSVALAASFIPALRAARLDPTTALRDE